MPMPDLRRNGNHHPRRQADRRFAFLLIPALAGGADQNLTAAFFCVMDMPVIAAARRKGDIGKKNPCLARICQRLQKGSPGKILRKGFVVVAFSKNIYLFKVFIR